MKRRQNYSQDYDYSHNMIKPNYDSSRSIYSNRISLYKKAKLSYPYARRSPDLQYLRCPMRKIKLPKISKTPEPPDIKPNLFKKSIKPLDPNKLYNKLGGRESPQLHRFNKIYSPYKSISDIQRDPTSVYSWRLREIEKQKVAVYDHFISEVYQKFDIDPSAEPNRVNTFDVILKKTKYRRIYEDNDIQKWEINSNPKCQQMLMGDKHAFRIARRMSGILDR